MKEAVELAQALSDGIKIEEILADEIERIVRDMGPDVPPAFDTAFRTLIRHHRAHTTMMQARLGGVVERFNLKCIP